MHGGTAMDMTQFADKKVIINAVTSWGKTEYSIFIEGARAPMVGTDKGAWEKAVQQLRDAGAIIVDNAAIKAEQDAAIRAMQAKMRGAK